MHRRDRLLSGCQSSALVLVPHRDYDLAMRIIAIKTLKDFWEQHPDAEQPLLAWLDEARKANWSTPVEIKAQFRNASILKSRRVVFNIKGNDYRLVAAVAYRFGAIYIKFVGTHKQYDAIDADTVDME
jgi:mRNA interferase HigB